MMPAPLLWLPASAADSCHACLDERSTDASPGAAGCGVEGIKVG